jgi:hypothetical protein
MNTMSINEVTKVIQSIKPGKGFDVTFVKKDGSTRTFFGCTLDKAPEGSQELPQALPVQTVDGWRSFRLDSVVEITQ